MLIYGCMLIEDLILEYYTGYEILKYYLLYIVQYLQLIRNPSLLNYLFFLCYKINQLNIDSGFWAMISHSKIRSSTTQLPPCELLIWLMFN